MSFVIENASDARRRAAAAAANAADEDEDAAAADDGDASDDGDPAPKAGARAGVFVADTAGGEAAETERSARVDGARGEPSPRTEAGDQDAQEEDELHGDVAACISSRVNAAPSVLMRSTSDIEELVASGEEVIGLEAEEGDHRREAAGAGFSSLSATVEGERQTTAAPGRSAAGIAPIDSESLELVSRCADQPNASDTTAVSKASAASSPSSRPGSSVAAWCSGARVRGGGGGGLTRAAPDPSRLSSSASSARRASFERREDV